MLCYAILREAPSFAGKLVTIIVLIIAAYAIDANAFGGRYRDEAIQQGNRFIYEVLRQLKKIGIE